MAVRVVRSAIPVLAEPLYMGNCHCRDCQRATGSAYFAAVIVKQSDFSLTGELAWFEKQADRGHTMGRGVLPFLWLSRLINERRHARLQGPVRGQS